MTSSPNAQPSSELYGMPSLNSASAKPMTPRPMRRVVFDIWSICGSGYWLTSITLSRKRVEVWIVALKPSQSKLVGSSPAAGLM